MAIGLIKQLMNPIIKVIALGLCIAACSCSSAGKIKPFQNSLAKHERLSFKSWDGKLKGRDCDMILHFEKDSKVTLEHRNIGVSRYQGSYQLGADGKIWARFPALEKEHPWPIMVLETDGKDLLIHRIDGYTSWRQRHHPDAKKPESLGFWPFRAKNIHDSE